MRPDDRTLAGLLFFVGAVQFLLALVVAEGALPDYRVSQDAISDLGVGPTAGLFNGSVLLVGLLTLGAAFFFDRAHGKRWLTGLFVLAGAGAMGVGLFPETTGTPHGVAAFTAFLFANVAAIAVFPVMRGPLRWLGVLAGIAGLVALGLFAGQAYLGIGLGGMERLIVYPVLLWEVALGGQLMSAHVPSAPAPPQTSEKT